MICYVYNYNYNVINQNSWLIFSPCFGDWEASRIIVLDRLSDVFAMEAVPILINFVKVT